MKKILTLILTIGLLQTVYSQRVFIHPGGLHTLDDLNRMKEKVDAGEHPWIDGWNLMIQDASAQSTYTASPKANMGSSRQRASADAHAAYLNAIRWYISGDEAYANCAINICNAWASTVNKVPSGNEVSGLGGIAISELAMAAEVLRICDLWQEEIFVMFKKMMVDYFYPLCRDFLLYHNGRAVDYYWANWDANNIAALVAIGVLCDNEEIYNEGINYFKYGEGCGSIKNAVPYIHPNGDGIGLGQWQEIGRDQEHGQLGVGLLGNVCQIAWNQGDDLFGYDNSRLLAGAEYVAQYNLWKEVPFTYYNNSQGLNNRWPAINGRGRLDDRPVWEMIYNHYAVVKGLSIPNTLLMAQLMRPEHGSNDHFGYGTLTFTLETSAYPPLPVPAVPTELIAESSVGKIYLKWESSEGNIAQGYSIQRAEVSGGEYAEIYSYTDNTTVIYTDYDITNGTTYYYRVAAINQSGISNYSAEVSAAPVEPGDLPAEWSISAIGTNTGGTAIYADVIGGTFIVEGYGATLGGTADDVTYTYQNVTGDNVITCRITDVSGTLLKTGLMIRESLDVDATAVTMTKGDAGWRFARMGSRTTTSKSMSFLIGNTYTWLPAWFRLKRLDNIFTAYESPNGVDWFVVGSVNIAMGNSYYVGLVVCPGSTTAFNTTKFDNVAVAISVLTPVITSSADAIVIDEGQALNYQIVATNSPIVYSATGLPEGVTIDSGTGIISGMPVSIGNYLIEFTVSNDNGSCSELLKVIVNKPIVGDVVLYYGLENIETDISENGFDASLINSPVYGDGYTGYGIVLDGTNQYVDMPDGILSTVDDITIAIWLKLDKITSWTRIFDFGTGTGAYMFLTPDAENGYLRFTLKNGSGEQQINTTSSLITGEWAHLAVTLEGDTGTIYLNGVVVGSSSSISINPSDLGVTTKNYIGHSQFALDPYVKGSFDDFRIYNRVISSEELLNIVNGTETEAPGILGEIKIIVPNNTLFNYSIEAVNTPTSYNATDLPFNFTVNTTTGEISGISTALGIYNFIIRATNEFGTGDRELIVQVITEVVPFAPQNFIENTINSYLVTLSWDASPENDLVTSYSLYRSLVSGKSYDLVAEGITELAYTDTNLDSNTNYYYLLTATNLNGESEYSEELAVAIPLPSFTPSDILGLQATGGDSKVVLQWEEVAGTNYNVYRADAFEGNYVEIASGTSTNSYIDEEVTNGITYYYYVLGTNSLGTGGESKIVIATPNAASVAYWPFDEATGSLSVDVLNGNFATFKEGVGWTDGISGSAVELTNNAYVELPTAIVNHNSLTISCWFKLYSSNPWIRIFDFGSGIDQYMFLSPHYDGVAGGVRFAIKNGGSEQELNYNSSLGLNEWAHITITLDGITNTSKMYFNGVEVASNTNMTINGATLGETTQNWLGRSQWDDPYFQGVIEDFRICSEALNADDIADIYTNTATSFVPQNVSASIVGGGISLTWDEVPLADNYVIKCATVSGGPYEVIASGVIGTTYIDDSVESNSIYYYVVSVNINGVDGDNSDEVSETAIVSSSRKGIRSEIDWKCYPNPVVNHMTIKFDKPCDNNTKLEIIDITGKVYIAKTIDGKNEISIDMSGLIKSVYLLRISREKDIKIKKVVKN